MKYFQNVKRRIFIGKWMQINFTIKFKPFVKTKFKFAFEINNLFLLKYYNTYLKKYFQSSCIMKWKCNTYFKNSLIQLKN